MVSNTSREAEVGDAAHEVQGHHQTGPEPAVEGADSIRATTKLDLNPQLKALIQ